MRAIILAAVVVCGLAMVRAALAGGDALPDAIGRLPELGRVSRGPVRVVLRGELLPAPAEAARVEVDRVVADLQHRLLRQAPGRAASGAVTMALLPDAGRYRQVGRAIGGERVADRGFYRRNRRLGVVDVGPGRATLRHELGHAVVGDDFPAIPAWLDEGLGELYESATVDAAGVHLGRGEGGGQLRAALRRGELPTLTQLATTADDELRGPRAPLLYALGAAVLRHVDQAGHLGDLYATIRANPRDPERHVAALRQYVDEDALRRLVAVL